MAGENRRTFSDLKRHLLKDGHSYSFFQVLRLLRFLVASPDVSEVNAVEDTADIRVRPDLSLTFPASDVKSVEEITQGEETAYRVTATFLGLYGASSPLPTFYTEDLMEEEGADESVTRDFLDVFNNRLYLLLFKVWSKYRQFLQVVEERNAEHIERLFCLLGLGHEEIRKEIPEAYRLLRYIGIFSQFPRSAAGLKSLVQDALGDISLDVRPCVFTMATIPESQRLSLGRGDARLGRSCYLGEQIPDRMGKFRLELGPVSAAAFQDLLPGGEDYRTLTALTGAYVTDSLEYDVEITLARGEASTACLGSASWSRLGLDTWVFGGDEIGAVKARFSPGQ